MPAKERHPSAGTSPQWRNVTPAKERHPSEGWGWGWDQGLNMDYRLRENDMTGLQEWW